ncbi:STAS domain-containing protein [Nannocystaceae bacterium ST9]
MEASRGSLEQATLRALRENIADNSGLLPPFRLPTLAKRVVAELERFLALPEPAPGLIAATGFGDELAEQGLGLRSWLAVGRTLTREFVAGVCGPTATSDEHADAVEMLVRLQLFVTQVVEGHARREKTEISNQRDEMQTALHRVIQAREDELRLVIQQLSTPVMPVYRQVLVLPLIGGVDDERARRITERLLDETTRRQARIVIIDLTGLAACDAGVLAALTGAVKAVHLLGARAVLAGINSELARALVELELDLKAFVALADLQSAIEWALRELGLAILPRPILPARAAHQAHQGNEHHGD